MKGKIKILLISQGIGKYYTDLAKSYIRAFEKMDVELKYFDHSLDLKYKFLSKVTNKVQFWADFIIREKDKDLIKIVESFQPEFIFVIKGIYLKPNTLKSIKEINSNIIISCFNPDDPFSLEKGSSNNNIREAIKYYDVYFIWNKLLLDKLKEKGSNEVYYLPFAADPNIIYPVELSHEEKTMFKCDISFVGNGDEERKRYICNIKSLMEGRGNSFNFRIYGDNWKKAKRIELKPKVEEKDLLSAFSGSKIDINILRKQNKKSHNMRTFEIPASGGFMLHERSEEAMGFFTEGVEAEYFSSPEELLDKCKYYLTHVEKRKDLEKKGYEKIFSAGYTYENRVREILGLVKKLL